MRDELKSPLVTLIKAVVSALVVFGSSFLSAYFGNGDTVALLGASIGTAINFS